MEEKEDDYVSIHVVFKSFINLECNVLVQAIKNIVCIMLFFVCDVACTLQILSRWIYLDLLCLIIGF